MKEIIEELRARAAHLTACGKKGDPKLMNAAADALEALPSIDAEAVRVPIEPTMFMISAAISCDWRRGEDVIRRIWRAMLQAAPATLSVEVCETCNGTGKEGRHSLCRDCDETQSALAPDTAARREREDVTQSILLEQHDRGPRADSYRRQRTLHLIMGHFASLVKEVPPQFLATEDGEFNGNEWEGPLTDEEQSMIDWAWEKHKAAGPVAKVINDNQPGNTAIIEILRDPPTLGVGTVLFAAALEREGREE